MVDQQCTNYILRNQQRHCNCAAMFVGGGGCLNPAKIIKQIMDQGWLALFHYPARQPFAYLEFEATAYFGYFFREVAIACTEMQQIIFRIEQHDCSLLGTDGIVKQSKCTIQCTVQVQAGRDLRKNPEESFCVLLFTL